MGYKLNVDKVKMEEILSRQRIEKNAKILKRLNCISMKISGLQNKEIAAILGVNENTITNWIKVFIDGGIDELCELKYDRSRKFYGVFRESNVDEAVVNSSYTSECRNAIAGQNQKIGTN